MLHALTYSFNGSDTVKDLIYIGYLAFMWGTLSLTSYLDNRRAVHRLRHS